MISALIPAAGIGSRLGRGPKAWLEIDGRPLLAWLVPKLAGCAEEVIVAVLPSELAKAQQLCHQYGLAAHCIVGGSSRQDSVLNMVRQARGNHVLIHDVVRPFVSRALLNVVATVGCEQGAAAAFLPVDAPVALLAGNQVSGYVSAHEAALFQAPQVFARARLLPLLETAAQLGVEKQSTVQLWLDAGQPIAYVAGEKTNIKLTLDEDWQFSQYLRHLLA